MIKKSSLLAAICGLAAFLLCTVEPLAPLPSVPSMRVTGFTADYVKTQNKIFLQWTPITDAFSFYHVKRFTLSSASNEDTLTSTEFNIESSKTSWWDVLGLENTIYYYQIRAFKVSAGVAGAMDTLRGYLDESGMDTAQVQTGVSFSINSGAVFTVSDYCTLAVGDFSDTLSNIRFTQMTAKYWTKGTQTRKVNVDDPYNPPSSDSTRSWLKNGWITSVAALSAACTSKVYPYFDSVDTRNDAAAREKSKSAGTIVNGLNRYGWWLKKGNGSKRVYVELTFKDGRKDTLVNNIEITPYRIQLAFRNKTGSSDQTMSKSPLAFGTEYHFYKPFVQFGISIFADTTILEDFDYWLCLADSNSIMTYNVTGSTIAWLETAPRHARLTGRGPLHDDDYVYTYSIDPSDALGKENLSVLRQTFRSPQGKPQENTDLAFRIKGEQFMNETCVPGSFWGQNVVFWDGLNKLPNPPPATDSSAGWLLKGQNIITTPVDSAFKAFNKIKKMTIFALTLSGTKQFWIVARFKGQYFDDVRVITSAGQVFMKSQGKDERGGDRANFDFYQPKATFWVGAADWYTNGSVITSTFNYALNPSPSISDQAGAYVSDIRLIIARNQNNIIPWTVSPNSKPELRNVTADTISIEALRSIRHIEIPFVIPITASAIWDVRWNNIDISNWPSDNYIMGVVARDRYGNEGFAPVGDISADRPYTNPWQVTILSGK